MTYDNPMHDPEVRRAFEEELLVGEATETLAALVDSLGLTQKELAERLGVSAGRVSQILSGAENLTLRSLGALAWSLGIRFNLEPVALADRTGTPALQDPPAPAWLGGLRNAAPVRFRMVESVDRTRFTAKISVVRGELAEVS